MELNMKKNSQPIPTNIAFDLCKNIRNEKGVRLFSQCWGCIKFSKNDPTKMCFSSSPDNRGCSLVSKRYDTAANIRS